MLAWLQCMGCGWSGNNRRSKHLAGDGHSPHRRAAVLQLDETPHLGAPIHQTGMVIPGMFIMGPGTNGHTAWGQTQLFGDITDWYVDELQLDEIDCPHPQRLRPNGTCGPLRNLYHSRRADLRLYGPNRNMDTLDNV